MAVAKIEDLHTGISLGDLNMPPIDFPTPMVGLAVTPKSRGDEGKLSGALHKIVEEDRTLQLDRDPQTKELVMTGMSELHLQILRERLKRRDKVEVDTKEPKIPYRETIQANGRGELPPQEANRRPRPVRRSPYPHVSRCPRGRNIEEFCHQGALSLDARVSLRRSSTTFCGSIRSSAARFPTTFCRPSKRASRSGWSAA